MFGFFGLGLAVIFLNYTGVMVKSPSIGYLVAGIALIIGGIVAVFFKQRPLLFAGLGLGGGLVLFDRLGWMPEAPSGWYLIVGLLAILAGIITATQLR